MTDDRTIICRCEEITLGTIKDTVQQYKCSPREVKLRTRAGMGYCGGRTCRNVIHQIVGELNNEPITDDVQLNYRSPIRPVALGVLGGGTNDHEG